MFFRLIVPDGKIIINLFSTHHIIILYYFTNNLTGKAHPQYWMMTYKLGRLCYNTHDG